jgi:Fur family transcriptional regulator, ferric uptake regulator
MVRKIRIQRQTRQRSAIRRSFEQTKSPMSLQQVLKAAKTEVRGLGIATVYRNVKGLLEEGWLTALDVPGAGTVYERADKAHHHHFHCERCRHVFDLSGCLPEIDNLAGRGFSVTRHEVVLYGFCNDCRLALRS